jgi:hypothetical protein
MLTPEAPTPGIIAPELPMKESHKTLIFRDVANDACSRIYGIFELSSKNILIGTGKINIPRAFY